MQFICPISKLSWQASSSDKNIPASLNHLGIIGYKEHPALSLSYREACKLSKHIGPHLLLIHTLTESKLVEFSSPLSHTPESLPNPSHWSITLFSLCNNLHSRLSSIQLNAKRLPHYRIQDGTNYQSIIDWSEQVIYNLLNLQQEEREAKKAIYIAQLDLSKSLELLRHNNEASTEICNRAMLHSKDKETLLNLAGISETVTITELQKIIDQALENKNHLAYHVARNLREAKNTELQTLNRFTADIPETNQLTLAELLKQRGRII